MLAIRFRGRTLPAMTASPWSPTQQVRALLLIQELSAHLAVQARARTLHGCPQLAAQLAAVGKRALPQALTEMTEWSALRLAGSREPLRTAISQFTGSAAWAERVTNDVVLMLRQGERFTDAAHRLDDLVRAIAATDEVQANRWFGHHLARMHRYCDEHANEDSDSASEVWSPAIDRLLKAAAALGVSIMPSPPKPSERAGGPPSADRTQTNGSTPYQPSSATEPGTGTGGSHALRRKR